MSGSLYTLPPYSEPQITLSQTPSPVREDSDSFDALIAGVELIVSKLPQNSVTTAAHHLRALLGEYNQLHTANPLAPTHVVSGDDRNLVDYAFVTAGGD